jgi:hypothetical protein
VRAPDPPALVVPGHAALLAAIDLRIGGVQVRRISALPVQAGQEVLPGQLRRRDPAQQNR